jgi:hypothetical protein
MYCLTLLKGIEGAEVLQKKIFSDNGILLFSSVLFCNSQVDTSLSKRRQLQTSHASVDKTKTGGSSEKIWQSPKGRSHWLTHFSFKYAI